MKRLWTHPKVNNKKFIGSYEIVIVKKKRERVFVLSEIRDDNRKPRIISFESWQQAKKQGWKLG